MDKSDSVRKKKTRFSEAFFISHHCSIDELFTFDQYALNWEETLFFLKFIFFLGIYIVPTLAVIFILFKFLMRLWYNRVAYTFFGTMAIGLFTAYWIWRTGGYLAFDLSTTIAGELLGIAYGAMLFPFYIKPIKKEGAAH